MIHGICLWLNSFNMLSKVPPSGCKWHYFLLFMAGINIPLLICRIIIIHSSTDGLLGCSHVLLWTLKLLYLFKLKFSCFLGTCPEVGLLDHTGALCLVFWNLHTILTSGCTVYIPTNSVQGSIFSTPSPMWAFLLGKEMWMEEAAWGKPEAGDFPGGPVTKILNSPNAGSGFDPSPGTRSLMWQLRPGATK